MSEIRKNCTFAFREDIKKDFQVECLINDNTMTEVLENFMGVYIRQSRKMRAEQQSVKQDGE